MLFTVDDTVGISGVGAVSVMPDSVEGAGCVTFTELRSIKAGLYLKVLDSSLIKAEDKVGGGLLRSL